MCIRDSTDPSPPTCITRALLIYARSDVVPASITHCPSWNTLREHPGFVFDAIFLHARANQSPKCPVSYTHLRAHETVLDLVCRLLLEKKKKNKLKIVINI
eukprot:TRINITY_DN12552_c0_g1_i1.p1 TRINITY_DN12552_c0_g1~~TRINITY_DN12552_c0_g1_i1.p1  ORF type:complete len:101 (-),score=4.70 TRINITY_DN12552_c0_g1_i1:8-310(-)